MKFDGFINFFKHNNQKEKVQNNTLRGILYNHFTMTMNKHMFRAELIHESLDLFLLSTVDHYLCNIKTLFNHRLSANAKKRSGVTSLAFKDIGLRHLNTTDGLYISLLIIALLCSFFL
jgi:hypothetical protein